MVKLKTFVLFVAVSILSIEALKFVSEDPNDFDIVRKELIMHKALLSQKMLIEPLLDPTGDKFDDTLNFLLPNNTIPTHYDINLSTDIHAGAFEFQGNVRIDITVLEASDTITIHSRQHNIQGIVLFNPDGSVFDMNPVHTLQPDVEFLIITSQNQFTVGQELTIEVAYDGILSENENDRGWFRSFYADSETNETVWLAATHMHPINARHAFPCYDEAQHRITIKLHLRHHQSYTAISNMPVESIAVDNDHLITTFETSPVMQIFVLSFIVSNFGFVSTIDDGLEFRVLARPEAIAAGEADNALEIGVTMLRTAEDYFSVNYSFPKSDQIANPQLEGDGSSNWGLLSFDENIVLQFNDNQEFQLNRERVLGHEFSVSFQKMSLIFHK